MRVESLELWTCNKTLRNLLGSNIRTLAALNVELKVVVLVNVVVYVAALVFVAFSDVLFGANLAVGIVSDKPKRQLDRCKSLFNLCQYKRPADRPVSNQPN